MKTLITGGCGFLGSNLAAEAIRLGHELMVFDNLFRQGADRNLAWLQGLGRFTMVQEDVRDPGAVARAVREFAPEAVFHTAGQVAMTTSLADPRLDFEINALGTLNVLEAVRAHAPDATVTFSSTNKVYGDLEDHTYRETETRYVCEAFAGGFPESIPLDFRTPYGCSKGAADQYMRDYSQCYGLKTVVFRHSSIFGGRQFATADQGWIGWFALQAIETGRDPGRDPFTINGNGKQVRDVLFASDLIALYHQAVRHIDRAAGQVFNIGGGANNSLSLLELFRMLEGELGIEMRHRELPPRTSDQKVFIADIAKAERVLDWRPQVSSREGVRQMLDWVREAA